MPLKNCSQIVKIFVHYYRRIRFMDEKLLSAFNRITDCYTRWYDVEIMPEESLPLAAKASFHETGTGYVLVRKAEMWTAEKHEYSYIYVLPDFTAADCEKLMEETLSMGEPLVDPKPGHMCTNISMIILCLSADEEARKALKKIRLKKSFKLSMHGWMEFHASAVIAGEERIISNPAGAPTARFLKKILYSKK